MISLKKNAFLEDKLILFIIEKFRKGYIKEFLVIISFLQDYILFEL